VNKDLLMLKGIISEMPQEDQDKIKNCKIFLDDLVDSYGSNGLLALAVIGLERGK